MKLKTIANIMEEIKANSLGSLTPIVISTLCYDFLRKVFQPPPPHSAPLKNYVSTLCLLVARAWKTEL